MNQCALFERFPNLLKRKECRLLGFPWQNHLPQLLSAPHPSYARTPSTNPNPLPL